MFLHEIIFYFDNGNHRNNDSRWLLSPRQDRRRLFLRSLQGQTKVGWSDLCAEEGTLPLTQIRMTRIKDKDRDNALNEVRILASQQGEHIV